MAQRVTPVEKLLVHTPQSQCSHSLPHLPNCGQVTKSNKWPLQLQEVTILTKRISFTRAAQTWLRARGSSGSRETNAGKGGDSTLIQCRNNSPAAVSHHRHSAGLRSGPASASSRDHIDQTSEQSRRPRSASAAHHWILPQRSEVCGGAALPAALGKQQV